MVGYELSSSEVQDIDAHLCDLPKLAKHARSFDWLLNTWERCVSQVEQGYADSIHEFENDLSSREILDVVARDVDSALRTRLMLVLKPIDDRYGNATVPASGRTNQDWFRVPKKLMDELVVDLRAEGLVK